MRSEWMLASPVRESPLQVRCTFPNAVGGENQSGPVHRTVRSLSVSTHGWDWDGKPENVHTELVLEPRCPVDDNRYGSGCRVIVLSVDQESLTVAAGHEVRTVRRDASSHSRLEQGLRNAKGMPRADRCGHELPIFGKLV